MRKSKEALFARRKLFHAQWLKELRVNSFTINHDSEEMESENESS
jgi:hypothetical protein